nr:BrnT family toxin [uncultured Rhodopila sp.]
MPEWTWDPRKDRLNQRTHNGLSLADGIPALSDPLAVSKPDPHPDGDRWQLVGSAAGVVVLFVVYADPVELADGSEIGRIISVRKATSHERKAYEQGNF